VGGGGTLPFQGENGGNICGGSEADSQSSGQ
jgi:hypothetical protein